MENPLLPNETAAQTAPTTTEGASYFETELSRILNPTGEKGDEADFAKLSALIDLHAEAEAGENRFRRQRKLIEKRIVRLSTYFGVNPLEKEKAPSCVPAPQAFTPPPGLPAPDPNANSANA